MQSGKNRRISRFSQKNVSTEKQYASRIVKYILIYDLIPQREGADEKSKRKDIEENVTQAPRRKTTA